MLRNIQDTSVALFCYKIAEVDVETVDFELILSHVFNVSNQLHRHAVVLTSSQVLSDVNTSFEIVIDCTAFSTKAILPLRWTKYSLELIPYDIRTKLQTLYVLNNNMEGLKYMKRVLNFCGCECRSLGISTR